MSNLPKVSKYDEEIFEIIYEEGINDLKKYGTSQSADEYAKCMQRNPQIQKLQDTYQVFLQNPNRSNKSILTNLITYIKNPTARNRAAYESAVTSAVNVRS